MLDKIEETDNNKMYFTPISAPINSERSRCTSSMCPKKRFPSGKSGLISAAKATIEDGGVVSSVPHSVGIGASAGGLEALQQLFSGMPTDSGLCFIVIVHHPPAGPSLLTDSRDLAIIGGYLGRIKYYRVGPLANPSNNKKHD